MIERLKEIKIKKGKHLCLFFQSVLFRQLHKNIVIDKGINMKKVLIISTSLHKNSNSEYLAKAFLKGAMEAGNQVEFVSLVGKRLNYCIGCLDCQRTQKCVIKDDAIEITEKAKNADVIVFATPIYYYEMCGQMKVLLDRMNPLFSSDYSFRDIFLLATAADYDESAMDGAVKGIEGWISCFEKAKLAHVVRGVGIGDSGDAKNHTDVLKDIYEIGRGIS